MPRTRDHHWTAWLRGTSSLWSAIPAIRLLVSLLFAICRACSFRGHLPWLRTRLTCFLEFRWVRVRICLRDGGQLDSRTRHRVCSLNLCFRVDRECSGRSAAHFRHNPKSVLSQDVGARSIPTHLIERCSGELNCKAHNIDRTPGFNSASRRRRSSKR